LYIFCSAYILDSSSSEAQQTKSFGVSIHGDRQTASLVPRTGENCWWKSNFKQICLSIVTKGGCSCWRYNCNRELVPDCWRSYRESTFGGILGTKRCLEADDLKVIVISDKCCRLAKYVGCW